MILTLELEEPVVTLEAMPQLLVEWPSRWAGFFSSIKPALARSEARLAGETPFGLIPFRIMIPSYLLEAFLIVSAIFVRAKIEQLRPYVVPATASHDVIYYSGDELPRTPDLGGAEAGRSGEAGGDQAHHPTQTIKVARGGSLVPEVVDAPDLKLPTSRDAVANLLAIRADPGPPPSEGLRSTRTTPRLNPPLIAPSADVIRDYTRNAIRLDPVAAPPASLTRNQPLAAPNLNAAVVPPAPSVASDHTLVAPALAPNVIPPAPTVSRDRQRAAPALDPSVAPPAENVRRDPSRAAPLLAANVVPPAPASVSRQFSSAPIQSMNPAVLPPPVSAPQRGNVRDSKMSLPAVVPPPPSGNSSFVGSLISKIFGPTPVVAPPPVDAKGTGGTSRPTLPDQVTPPPASVSSGGTGGTGTGTRSAASYGGSPSVVPPPPALAENGGGTGKTGSAQGTPGGRTLPQNVVPPPSSLGGGPAATGSGLGRRGSGLGPPSDIANGGSSKDSGTVMSSQPGTKIGLPPDPKTGSLAMSPAGGDKSGSGGTGGGAGIGRGTGPGSGMTGRGTGAGKTDTGHGSDPSARAGISGSNGPGGAGNLASGSPPVQGVDITGGTGIVTLPSFGGSDSPGNDSATPGRSRLKTNNKALDLDIVASAGAGGAFAPYKSLFHSETHTIYIDTIFGTVSMEYADESGTSHNFSAPLSPPAPLETDLPDGLPHARMMVTCTLNASGNLTNPLVLEAGPTQMTAKVLAALRHWKFTPAMRNNRAVEVTAILGFGIDTSDRF